MKNTIITIACLLSITLIGCRDYLDEKSDMRLTTPQTKEDNQAILDRINNVLGSSGVSGELSSDDFYVSEAEFNTMSVKAEKRLYTWQPDYVAKESGNDWMTCYRRINIFNNVLDNIEQYRITEADNIKGQALTLRAANYLDAAQIYCLVYNKNSAETDMGLPLRLNSDMNVPSVRKNLQETYNLILEDLLTASNLLPITQISATRPSKRTALGYLARVCLYMGEYEKALGYGKQILLYNDSLMDFNTLNGALSYPIQDLNPEVLLPTTISASSFLSANTAKIPSQLFNSYHENDLRKSIFFKKNSTGDILFKGNYTGGAGKMTGVANDEIYLIIAESYARLNAVQESMTTLNQLLYTRWKIGKFLPFTANTKEEALAIIATERRKELLLRGIRWSDIKRYNRDGANITLTKTLNGENYILSPNDLRYAVAIPEFIIKQTGIPQNKRK